MVIISRNLCLHMFLNTDCWYWWVIHTCFNHFEVPFVLNISSFSSLLSSIKKIQFTNWWNIGIALGKYWLSGRKKNTKKVIFYSTKENIFFLKMYFYDFINIRYIAVGFTFACRPCLKLSQKIKPYLLISTL